MIFSAGRCLKWLLAALVVVGSLADSRHAAAQGSARFGGTASGSTVAFVLTISGRPLGVVAIPVSDIRAAAASQLGETLTLRGLTVVPEGRVLNVMREWRVRDGGAISRGFLETLADSLNVQLLLVANLLIQRDGLIMTARYLDVGTAIILNVGMTEWNISARGHENSTEWLEGTRATSAAIADTPVAASPPGKRPILILDTEPVGCSDNIALIASHSILDYYVEGGNRPVIDPGVTIATLRDAGFSERYLGADTRALLQETFGCRALVISRLISYAPARRSAGQIAEYDEYPDDGLPMATDFAMSLRLIDLASGSIAGGKEVFLPVPGHAGWFGVPRRETLVHRLRIAASHLWPDINNALEEF